MSAARKYDDVDLPYGWRMVRLGDVAWVDTGGTPRREVPEYWDGDIPWMASAEVNQSPVTATAERITEQGLKNSNAKVFPTGTVMVAMNGQGATRGKATILAIESSCNQSLAAIRSNPQSNNQFIFHVLSARYEDLRGMTGEGRNGLNLDLIRRFHFLLPPLPEQRAIADVLDSIDEAIERTEGVIAATETLRDSLLHELLTRGVPGWHTEWKDVPGIGAIPADWEVVRLGEVLESTTYGTNEPLGDTGNIVVLRMNNIQQGEIDWSEVKRGKLSESELNYLDLRSGDILFNRTNSLDLVGKIGIVREMPDTASFASYLVRLRTKTSQANPTWLAALLASNIYQSRIRRFATPGVSQANINPTSLRSLTIPNPPIAEQQAISVILDSVDEQLYQARAERDALATLKGSTADSLLSGSVQARML